MASHIQGTIYLLHFVDAEGNPARFGHAAHYLGFATNLDARLRHHAAGTGANLLRHVKAAGLTWTLVRTWPGTKHDERRMKCSGHARRCPDCQAAARAARAERRRQQPPLFTLRAGQVVRHACDTPSCVNPAHLSIGTHADNVADRLARGRTAAGERRGRARLTDAQVAELCQQHAEGASRTQLASAYGVSRSHVGNLLRGARRVPAFKKPEAKP